MINNLKVITVFYFEGFLTLAGTQTWYHDLADQLSMIPNKVIDFIYNIHRRRIIESSHDFLIPARLKTYVDALYAGDEALENCFVFVDCTYRPIAVLGIQRYICMRDSLDEQKRFPCWSQVYETCTWRNKKLSVWKSCSHNVDGQMSCDHRATDPEIQAC